MAAWGAASGGSAVIQGAASFYALRLLLAESGLVPGVILYLTFWFPKAWVGRTTAIFMAATIVAPVVGGPTASMLLGLDGLFGIHGWRWLFLIEGLPPLLIALAVICLLPDGPARAAWLQDDEKSWIEHRIGQEDDGKERDMLRALRDRRVMLPGIGYGLYLSRAMAFPFGRGWSFNR